MDTFFRGFYLLLVVVLPVYGQVGGLFGGRDRVKPEIVVNNRVVAKVNQKPISVFDLMKKMDLAFYRQYPQYADSPEIRYQFYTISWKDVLEEFIDKELIIADAGEMKVEVPANEIRHEIEKMFGPNIVENLDKAGFTFEEAQKLLKEEQTIQRMMYLRVNSKAMSEVTPQEIRLAYDRFLKDYDRQDQWEFHVITLQDPNPTQLDMLVAELTKRLLEEVPPLDDFPAFVKATKGYNPFSQVKVSEQMLIKENDLSPAYKEALSPLDPGEYSAPRSLVKEGGKVYKIYYLSDVIVDQYPTFAEMAPKLKGEMLGEVAARETANYKKKLRKQYPISTIDLRTFEPFVLMVNGEKVKLDPPPKNG